MSATNLKTTNPRIPERVPAKTPLWEANQGIVALTLYAAPEPTGTPKLTSRQAEFMRAMALGKIFKAGDYVRQVEGSERQARRDLADLEKLGLVVREGAGPSTVYRIVSRP